jgi:hypothetical protein
MLNRRQKLNLVSKVLRTFHLTDDSELSALFLDAKLPTPERIANHIRVQNVLLPPSVTPEFLAEHVLSAFRDARPAPPDTVEISCWDIDQFRPFKDVDIRDAILPLLIPEHQIKDHLNSLLGEAESAADWGGEDDDIFAQCSLNGRELPIAFMLKGRSVPRPMRLRDAGKNSDQVLRVTEAPAAIFVVQHVDKITEPVRRQLRMNVEALRSRGHEAYCTFIDGFQTFKLLFGKLKPGTGDQVANNSELPER